MSSDMLRTSKSCLADGTLVIPSHCVRSSRSQSRLEKKKKIERKKKKNGRMDWFIASPQPDLRPKATPVRV